MADGEVGEAAGPVLVRHPPLTHPGHQLALLLPRQRAVRPDVFIAPPSLEIFLVNHPFCRFQAHPPLEGVTPGVPDLEEARQLGRLLLRPQDPSHSVGMTASDPKMPEQLNN